MKQTSQPFKGFSNISKQICFATLSLASFVGEVEDTLHKRFHFSKPAYSCPRNGGVLKRVVMLVLVLGNYKDLILLTYIPYEDLCSAKKHDHYQGREMYQALLLKASLRVFNIWSCSNCE